jgi:hypothetical protein
VGSRGVVPADSRLRPVLAFESEDDESVNVEVKVVREKVTTYLVRGVRSLEEAERIALAGKGKRLEREYPEPYVEVSYPVLQHREEETDGDGTARPE